MLAVAEMYVKGVSNRDAGDRRRPSAAEPRPAVGKGSLPKDHAGTIHQTDLMRLGRPVDAGKTFEVIMHGFTPSCFRACFRAAATRTAPCTGALRRNSPPGLRHGRPTGARVPPPGALGTGGIG